MTTYKQPVKERSREVYFGAALVGINEHEWSKNKVLPYRTEIVVGE